MMFNDLIQDAKKLEKIQLMAYGDLTDDSVSKLAENCKKLKEIEILGENISRLAVENTRKCILSEM